MTIDSTDPSGKPSNIVRSGAPKRVGKQHRLPEPTSARADDELRGWPRAMERLLQAAMRGEIGTVVDRWQATTLAELRDALDAAIAAAAEAGHEAGIAGPVEVVLAHYPRAPGGPYKVRFRAPLRPNDDA